MFGRADVELVLGEGEAVAEEAPSARCRPGGEVLVVRDSYPLYLSSG